MNMRPLLFAPVAALFVLLLIAPSSLHAQELRLYRVAFTDPADLTALASSLDVWEVDHTQRTVLAPLTDTAAQALRSARPVELAADQSPLQPAWTSFPPVAAASGIPGFACYRTVEETAATLEQLADTAPNLARLITIGPSWERATGGPSTGYDLQVLVVTNRQLPGPKPLFVLVGAIHARELTTAETATRFAEHLISGYGVDPVVTWMLDHAELHVIPMANPDGRKRAETGLLWRKNTNNSAGACSGFSTVGVDLNRNSSFQWNSCPGCSSGLHCSDVYRGVAPASEPETNALESYVRSVIPTRRPADLTSPSPTDTAGLLISIHSYGNLILFPWGWTNQAAPNRVGLETLGRKLASPLGYRVCQAGADSCLYRTDGTTDDWAYGELGIAAFTYELGTQFFQACTTFEENIYPSVLESLRTAFLAAPLPYRLPAGPDTVTLTVTAPDASTVQITLEADATRYAPGDLTLGEGTVTAARYTLNAAPWDPAHPTRPLALDGEPGPLTQFSATLDAACLPTGRHLVVAQAQNQTGDWGIPTAQFLTITNPSGIHAHLTDATTTSAVAVTHTLRITNTTAQSMTVALSPLASAWPVTATTQTVGPIPPGASVANEIIILPITNTTGAVAPVGILLQNASAPQLCLEVYAATRVDAWQLRFPLIVRTESTGR